ncbi:hydrolase-like protein [Dothistroma septosporum NZE10]|uniref:Hydrolase-like protein n=1 Tax=Dothistroma septosporum (strain NZE10 / CBS 128990) TaxID=675120 RepID=N1PDQ0_DOTSN|nr:hydrolase-like protein [Dothistroma septosporum NZE10]
MPNKIQNLYTVDNESFPYLFEQNSTVTLKSSDGLVRVNIYRPRTEEKVPVLVTYGPYGKDIPYADFYPRSFSELNPQQKSEHSAWETPDPAYWTSQGYAVVRADERGTGQSPGFLDTMSKDTSEAFFEVVEWCAEQSWSSGKGGLLGISYYAGTQWRVAARQPKGLSCIIPWEGMSDYYRDRCRHGGILSDAFIKFWWDRQVVSNQYGRPGRKAANWGPDTIEGDLSEEEREKNRRDQIIDNEKNRFRDDDYYASKEFDAANIKVPLLSVANWGGILLHLRGDVRGYLNAGSDLKYLRFITGRHDLPFYYEEEVAIQKSFLDAFLNNDDRASYMVLRKGDVGFNNAQAEKAYPRRTESEWPIARTQYTRYYLNPMQDLTTTTPASQETSKLTYKALGTLESPQALQFTTPAFTSETKITGHITAHLSVSCSANEGSTPPSDIDIFLTLRHISPARSEIFYTGTAGDPFPLTEGWLRVSLRKVETSNPKNTDWLPHREYRSSDVQEVKVDVVYEVDVEVWPTNVVVEEGGKLLFEVASGDTQGSGIFQHGSKVDRSEKVFAGVNNVHFGEGHVNYVVLPVIPPKETR